MHTLSQPQKAGTLKQCMSFAQCVEVPPVLRDQKPRGAERCFDGILEIK